MTAAPRWDWSRSRDITWGRERRVRADSPPHPPTTVLSTAFARTSHHSWRAPRDNLPVTAPSTAHAGARAGARAGAGVELGGSEWRARAAAHRARVEPWVTPRLERRRLGQKHPVDDFLFEYYSYRPGQLLTWHPGFGVTLLDAEEYVGRRGYERTATGVTAGRTGLRLAAARLDAAIDLLERTASRSPEHACFGRHEWAMVYRTEDVRHAQWPLRLSPDEIAEVVESSPLRCTHFDAFRFYSDAARPRNAVQPTRGTQAQWEQPGCLHAGMDLYRWTFTFTPWMPSDLVSECFDNARAIRRLDMQVAPYDLTDLGIEPVRIETADGRAEFARQQRGFAERSSYLRSQVLSALRRLRDA